MHLSLSMLPGLVHEALSSMEHWGVVRSVWGMLLAVAHVDDCSHYFHDCGKKS